VSAASGALDRYRCARAGACRAAEVDHRGRRVGVGLEQPDTLCGGCVLAVRRAVAALPRDYAELELILDVRGRAGEKVSGSPELPVPPRLDVLVAQANLDAELSCWVEPVAETLGVDWDTTAMAASRPGPRITRAANLLEPHVGLLLRLEPLDMLGWTAARLVPTTRTGLDGALALLQCHQRARLLSTGGSGDVRLPVPCPSCEGLLVRRNGLSHVACQSCPRTWPEADYARLCAVLADDYRAVAG
jgi:hypothetical protein